MKHKLMTAGRRKLLLITAVAVTIALLVTAFPLQLETRSPGISTPDNAVVQIGTGGAGFRITIGTPVHADTADYTCDGTADDDQFDQALDALPAEGGQIFVMAGTYNWAALTTVTRAIDNVSVVGVGGSVVINTDDVTAAFSAGGNNWLFSNLQVDAGGLTMGATTDWMWLNVEVNSVYYSLRTDSINVEDHSVLHESGGADAIKLDDFASPDDNTDLDATTGVHGLMPGDDKTKLDGVEAGATVYPDTGEQAFLDADHSKLDGIEAGATQDQTGTEIKTAYEGEANTNAFTDAEQSKLSNIEALADVTANAGAVMESDVDAKGDIFVATADNILTTLALGTNGYVLSVNTSTASGIQWSAISGSGNMNTSTYDTDTDGDIDTAAGGTEWDSSAATGFAYVNSGSWDTKSVDTSDDTNLTAGDALTLTDDDIDFDGGDAPAGELGGTWANPTVDSGIHDDEYIEVGDTFAGDVSGTYGAIDITESVLGVGGTDAVFPDDPDDDWFLMWDDAPTGELVWIAAPSQLTEEEVEDYVGGMLGGTETLISVDYQDGSGTIDFVVDEASIDHGSITGLDGDDHSQYIKDSEFTQNGGFLVGTGAGTFTEETTTTARASLGLPAAGVDSTAIHDNVAGEIAGIASEKGTPISGDWIVIEDSADSNNKKKVQIGNLPAATHALGTGQSDVVITSVADDEVLAYDVGGDWINQTAAEAGLLADTTDIINTTHIDWGSTGNQIDADDVPESGTNFWASETGADVTADNTCDTPGGAGTDTTAIHDNVDAEISVITEKGSPVGGDWLLIEDSAASNAKKRIQVGNLPAAVHALGAGQSDVVITGVANDEVLAYDTGGDWINQTAAEAGLLADSNDIVKNTHIDWGSGAGQVDADDVPESGTRFWAGETGADVTDAANVATAGAIMAAGTDNVNDTHIAWGAGATQVDADDVPESGTRFWAGETGADVTGSNTCDTPGGAGTDTTAIHDNVAGEIAAITLKGTPVSGDLLLIEDSAATNAKKYITVGSLPSSTHALGAGQSDVVISGTPADNEVLAYDSGGDWINQTPSEAGLQAWDDDLDDLAALTPTDSYFIVGDDSDWVTETGATVRTSLDVYSTSDVDTEIDTDISTHVGLGDPHTGYVLESLFDADTFLYASGDDTPVATSPANVLAALSTHAGAEFDWGSQDLDGIGVLFLNEQADHETTQSDKGQIWVQIGAPNTLWFTDDGDTDYQLGVGGHSQQHSITATADHTSTATSGQILQADANGLPVDASNTDAQVSSAVSASHTQGTDTALGTQGEDLDMGTWAITNVGNVDGRDVGTDGSTLDTLNTNALLDSDFNAYTILMATTDDTPVAITVAEQTLIGRLTGGAIDDIVIGIADNNILQVDDAGPPADDEFARFTNNGIEGLTAADTLAALSGTATSAFDWQTQDLTDGGVIFLNEQADAEGDVVGDGQIWVNTASPNELYFTNDDGIDRRLDPPITITFVIDGGGAEIADGQAGHLEIPFACYITGWTIVADQSGSIVIDVWNDVYASFPPTVTETIAGSEKPTITTDTDNQDLTLTTWTEEIAAGDVMAFNVDSCTTIERVTLSIVAYRT